MGSQITVAQTLTFAIDSNTGGLVGPTPQSLKYDFTAPAKFHDERQTLSSAFAAVNLGDVGWAATTGVSWVAFKNASSTVGENINLQVMPNFFAGFTNGGSVAAASLITTPAAAGYYYFITTAGTIYGKTWAVGDIAIYYGTPSNYLQLRPYKLKLLPGEQTTIRMNPDGTVWNVNADAGTPQITKVAVGACS